MVTTRFHFELIPGIFFLTALCILLGLGTWQVQRLNWKNNLIERISARTNQAAAPLPKLPTWKVFDLDKWEYRVVEARGSYDHGEEVHIFTQLPSGKTKYSGVGYWLIVPFQLNSGGTVLVNRGFLPERFKNQNTRPDANPKGEQTIRGIIKTSQGTNYFTPGTDFQKNIWFTRDIEAISQHLELKNAAPFMISLTPTPATNPLPQPREINIALSNNHLGYALTWYGLALTLIGVFTAFSFRPRKP